MITPQLLHSLHSLTEDARFAYHQALDGDESGLEALGRSMKMVEAAVIAADAEKRLQARQELGAR